MARGLAIWAASALFISDLSLVRADQWRPSDDFLKAVRRIESSDGLMLWGDDGQSLGDFQLSEAAWVDVNAWRKTRRIPTYNYLRHVYNRRINRSYASDYFVILYEELGKRLKRPPSHGELYAAYNMGLSQFAQCRYSLAQVNAVTQRKCQTIEDLLMATVSAEVTSVPVVDGSQ